jgi:hypothetical protein
MLFNTRQSDRDRPILVDFIITKGKGKMMGEGDRQSEEMRWNLVNFVRSLAAKGATQKPAAAPPSS